ISGRVLDARRAPVVNAEVRAMRRLMRLPGQFELRGGARATTDGEGAYSITGLNPGDYVVVAPSHAVAPGPTPRTTSLVLPPGTIQRDGSKLGYVTTFFPGVLSRDGARHLTIRQTHISDIDIAL